jgi:drug/metabolite transporter (DMT)-like permease
MTAIDPDFGRKARDAEAAALAYRHSMIRITMNGRDWAILGALALIWGGAFFLIGVAVRHVPPSTYVLLRLAMAATAMWAILAWRRETLSLPREAWGAIVLLALLNNALPFTLFGWAQTSIASGLASILNATTPIWGVIVAHWFTADERMTPRKIAGVVIGFGGVAVMIGPGLLSSLGGGVIAELACVVASLSYALAGVWARRFKKMGVSPFSVTTGQLTVGAAMMLPVALIGDRPWTMDVPPIQAWAAIATLAVVCTALGYVLYFRLIDQAGATNALLVTLLVPPTAILLGVLFLDEIIAPLDFAGLGLIALGLAAIDGRALSALRRLRTGVPQRAI